MRIWLAALAATALMAQEPAPTPVPAPAEPAVSGTIDFGYQGRTGVGGSFDSYRSVVNLGSGPRLFGVDLTITSPTRRWFDRIDIRANNWGGDPYNTARVDATRHGWYNLSFDYRNIAYFNALPSYADPTLSRGLFLDQRSFDTHRRMSNVELELMPGKWIVPYLAYSHDSGFGRGITDFVSDANEYPVANSLRDKTDNFRGGVRLELKRFHVTLEQGGTTFKDDQQAFTGDQNFGNRVTPLLGERLDLTNLVQAYAIRGSSIYSKALVTASPFSWIDITGQFLYSRPKTNVNFSQVSAGQFVDLSTLLFFNSQLDLLTAQAKQPHTTASIGFELRPMRRVRVIESLMTDRLHNASSAQLTEQVVLTAAAAQLSNFTGPLVWNYNQQQVDVLFDLSSHLTLRAGHRYVWGDAQTQGGFITDLPSESGVLSRQVGLAGLTFRAGQRLSVNLDFEGASGDRAYFRTSLQNYRKARLRGRYQATPTLVLSAVFSILDNHNPAPTVNYEFQSHDASLAVLWTPANSKRVAFSGEYSRSALRSDIVYFVPQTLEQARSFYRDNAHVASSLIDIVIPGIGAQPSRLSVGGSFFVSSGSRPTRYYQPLAKLSFPVHKGVSWVSEWRYYGFGEAFYAYESFRTHLISTGLRLSR
jgi:hypothetical protein